MSDLSAYELAWPRDLFVAVAEATAADYDAVKLLLIEAFTEDRAARAYKDDSWATELPAFWVNEDHSVAARDIVGILAGPVVGHPVQLVRVLVQHVDELPTAGERRPYWTERRTGTAPRLDATAVRTGFARVVKDLYDHGYFEQDMPKHCPDDRDSGVDPDEILTERLGRAGLWPLRPGDWDDDTFFDLIEVFHDLAARPQRREWHR
jgi:hypothetical protein